MSLNFTPICLLWDVDGTLIDTTSLITDCLEYVFQKHYGKSLSVEDRKAIIGTPLWKQIRIFGEPEEFGVTEAIVMNDFIQYYEWHGHEERILEDVTSILRDGKLAGIPTGLVTSKNRLELVNTLPRLGVSELVDVVISADDVVSPKPSPEGIVKAMKILRISAAEPVCYIGDTTHDMEAARDAGVIGIGVTWGAGNELRLRECGAKFVVNTADELRALLI